VILKIDLKLFSQKYEISWCVILNKCTFILDFVVWLAKYEYIIVIC